MTGYNSDDGYLDIFQLTTRGWTRSLIKSFMPEPDRWGSVAHWKNYKGKALFSFERVLFVEKRDGFKGKFEKSISRRKLSEELVAQFAKTREEQNALYSQWLKSLKPEDVKTMLVAEEVTAIFNEAIARGYRTPHK